jgi:hypothetical protein
MIIDCDQCQFVGTEECKDCFVMAVLARPDKPIELDPEEEEAMANLQKAGLAPVLKFQKKAG